MPSFMDQALAAADGVRMKRDVLQGQITETARRVAKAWTLPGVGERTEIRIARWGPQAGVRGAALLAHQELAEHARDVASSRDKGPTRTR